MASQEFLLEMYKAHLMNLKDIFPDIDIFVCPICFREFTMDAIHEEQLTDGHVWPEYIRQICESEKIKQQRVLLCARCNHISGTRGDKQLQLRERIKRGDETGELFGERRVEIIKSVNDDPIVLRSIRVERTGPNSINMTGKLIRKSVPEC